MTIHKGYISKFPDNKIRRNKAEDWNITYDLIKQYFLRLTLLTKSITGSHKITEILHINKFEISAPKCPNHYSPARNGDVFDIIVHKNVRLSEVIVSDILPSYHLPIIVYLLDHIRRNLSDPVEKLRDLERFGSLASELISPRVQVISGKEANKNIRDSTAFLAPAYRLLASKITFCDLLDNNIRVPSLESLVKHLVKETRDPACKTAVN
jgi:hypothetical protein